MCCLISPGDVGVVDEPEKLRKKLLISPTKVVNVNRECSYQALALNGPSMMVANSSYVNDSNCYLATTPTSG